MVSMVGIDCQEQHNRKENIEEYNFQIVLLSLTVDNSIIYIKL